MKFPAMNGPLEGLKVLETDDLSRFRKAVEHGQQNGWKYYFPYLMSLNRPGRSAILIDEDEGSICIFIWKILDAVPRLDLYLAPTPMNINVLSRCLERANEFNRDASARVLHIDEKDIDSVSAANIQVREHKSQFIFDPKIYGTLAGKQLYTVRRNVSRVEKLPELEVKPYSIEHAEACHNLLEKWKTAHRAVHGTMGGVGTSRRAIELTKILPVDVLNGEVVFIDGQIASFAFGGSIRPGLACSLERKCNTGIRGLSYFQFRSFLNKNQDFELLNDGSDTGRDGLRQLKDSFRPVTMHKEYRGRQRN